MHAVARQKVEESMSDSVRLQGQLDNSKPKLADVQTAIEQEKNTLSCSVEEFQDKVGQIASELLEAKSFYKNTFLTTEADKRRKELENLDEKEQTLQLRKKPLKDQKETLEKKVQYCQSEYGVETLLAEVT